MSSVHSTLRCLAARTSFGRRAGLDRAWREEAFRRYVEARQLAGDSTDMRDHAAVGRAYRAFLRTYLRPVEGRLVEMEDEIIRLRAALEAMRESMAAPTPNGAYLRVVPGRSGDTA